MGLKFAVFLAESIWKYASLIFHLTFINELLVPFYDISITGNADSSYNCDQACENRVCGHMKFDYFFELSWLKTFYDNKLCSQNLLHLLNTKLAIPQKLQNANILLHCWILACNVIGCSLCPNALTVKNKVSCWHRIKVSKYLCKNDTWHQCHTDLWHL